MEDSTFERDLSPVARLLAAHDVPSSSEVFLKALSSEVNHEDVRQMKDAQEHMLQRFEKTNEMLLNFNTLSSSRYEMMSHDFKHHTQLLVDMKKDLNNIFTRIRTLKAKLNKQFPESFKATQGQRTPTLLEEDEEEVDNTTGETSTANVAPSILCHERPDIPSTKPSHARNWQRAARAEERTAAGTANVQPSEETVPKIVEPAASVLVPHF